MKGIGTHNQGRWEAWVKADRTFKGFNMLWGKVDVEGLHVSMKLLHFPPADEGEDIRSFLKCTSAFYWGHGQA